MNKATSFIFNFKDKVWAQKAKDFIRATMFLCLLLYGLFYLIMPQYEDTYTASVHDKYTNLHNLSSPKIILVADSNLAFGIDSKLIEDAFDMPVVNFGLHGGLGQTVHTDLIRSGIGKGDIVVVAPAEFHVPSGVVDPVLLLTAIENDWRLWKELNLADIKKVVIKGGPTYFKKALNLFVTNKGSHIYRGIDIGSAYARCEFNSYGDNTYVRKSTIYGQVGWLGEAGAEFYLSDVNTEYADYLNKYNEFVQSKGATLLIASPPIWYVANYSDEQLLKRDQNISTQIAAPYISKTKDYVYPVDYFYDGIFHLTDEGKRVRTNQLIADLKTFLES